MKDRSDPHARWERPGPTLRWRQVPRWVYFAAGLAFGYAPDLVAWLAN